MSAITAAQSGNWSSTSTWTGGVVPGDGDTVTITTQNVTMDQNTTVGASGATGTAAITISSTGKLVINSGVTLNLKGDLVNTQTGTNFTNTTEFLTVGAGVTINIVAPNGTTKYNIGTGATGQTARLMSFNGTSASPITIQATTPGTGFLGCSGTGINAGAMYARWLNCIDLGSTTQQAILWRPGVAAITFDVQYCRFTRCGAVSNAGTTSSGGAQVYKFNYNVFENSVGDGTYCFLTNGSSAAATTGALELRWNYFDIPARSTNHTHYFTVEDNWFNGLSVSNNTSPLDVAAATITDQWVRRNVFRKFTGTNQNLDGINVDSCYAIIDNESDNPHFIDVNIGSKTWDITMQKTAFEFTGNTVSYSSDWVGDLVLMGDSRNPDRTRNTVTVTKCLAVPSGTKYPPGAFVTHFAAGSNNLTLKFEHNTSFLGSSNGALGGTVSIHEGAQRRAVGTVTLSGGAVTGITVTDAGQYSGVNSGTTGATIETATVTIVGDGTGATAHCVMSGTSPTNTVASVVIDTPGSGYTTATAVFSFPAYSSTMGSINSIKSNLFWDYSVNSPAVWQWSQATNPSKTLATDIVPPTTVDYNGMYNVRSTLASTDHINQGGGYACNFSVVPGTPGGAGQHDIQANPQFLDTYRNFFTFSTKYLSTTPTRIWVTGGTYSVGDIVSFSDPTYYNGTSVNFRCIQAHTHDSAAKKPGIGAAQTWRSYWQAQSLTDIKNLYLNTRAANGITDAALGVTNTSPAELLRTWVYKGFTPTNTAFKATGHDGLDIGAVSVLTPQAFTTQRVGNWSVPSDNASSPWYDGGAQTALARVPTSGDTVTINHAVTCTADVTIGSSPVAGTTVATIGASGSVTVNTGVTFRLRGDALYTGGGTANFWVMQPGSTLMFDSSQAASPTSTSYRIGAGVNGNPRHFQAYGTSGSRITVTSDPAGTPGRFGNPTFNDNVNMDCRYTDFSYIGSASQAGWDCVYGAFESNLWDMRYCTFNYCGIMTTVNGTAGNLMTVRHIGNKHTNSLGATAFSIGSLGSSTNPVICTDNIFDIRVWATVRFVGGVVERNYFGDNISVFGTATTDVLSSFRDNLIRIYNSFEANFPGNLIQGNYFLVDGENANPHFFNCHGLNADISVLANTFEANNIPSSDAGDIILSRGGTKTITIKNNISLPRNDGAVMGSVTFFGDAPNTLLLTENNTFSVGGGIPGSVNYENFTSYQHTHLSHRNNIHYCVGQAGSYSKGLAITKSAGGTNPVPYDIADPAVVDYNCSYNLYDVDPTVINVPASINPAGSTTQWPNKGRGYSGPFSSVPGVHDLFDTNPQFVDWTRSIQTAAAGFFGLSASRGTWSSANTFALNDTVMSTPTGGWRGPVMFRCTSAHAGSTANSQPGVGSSWRSYWEMESLYQIKTNMLAGTTYSVNGNTGLNAIQAVRDWVRLGFAPKNTALKGTGYGSADIGAMAVNYSPVVNAGLDQDVFDTSLPITLTASVLDDGVSTYLWSKVSGPGTVTFGASTALTTTVNFSTVGTYVLRLTATDEVGQVGTDDVQVVITPYINSAPVISSATAAYPVSISLSGSATDDQTLTYQWSKVSGPGTVTFGSATSANTTATFSAAGTYVLRFSANDGFLTSTTDVNVVLSSGTSGTNPVVMTFGFGFGIGL